MNKEPDCWWLPGEREKCANNIIISEPRKNWLGKVYREYTSLPQDNIYGIKFIWREYGCKF